MAHQRNIYLSNMELDEALQKISKGYADSLTKPATETLSVPEALERITAAPIFAKLSSPFYNASAMDGIAVKAEKTYGANERTPICLKRDVDYVVVDTGDPILDPWDAVIMVEDIVELDSDTVEIRNAISPWDNVRPVGEDIVVGELILPAYHKISPIDLGALLSGGVTQVTVLKKPKVALLPTGTEIIEPHEPMEVGKIIESNSRVFEGIVRQCGGDPCRLSPVADDYQRLKKTISEAVEANDLVIINAGSSAGTEDFTASIIGELGEVIVHGLAIKPGKPAILGMIQGKPVIGIPGYPVSAWVVFDSLVKPLIYSMLKQRAPERAKVAAVVSRRIVSSLKHQEFVRVKLGKVGERLIATPLSRGAGVTMSLVKADGILTVPLNSEGFEAGETVDVELLRSLREIENTVVLIGSHDLVVDLLSDRLHSRWPEGGLSSAHVGSMAGLMALKRGEAHIAPIHLLDEATGEYNHSYVKRVLPDFPAALIKGVRRIQGLMLAPENPKGIETLGDLKRPDVRFVNRQRGSGTRLLLDFHLSKLRIPSETIQGYTREMTTHMAVASAVQSGTADVGLGIEAAASALGLDFIPIGVEEYDFLVPQSYLDSEPVQQFIKTLCDPEFHKSVLQLGGYELDSPGTVIPL